MKRWHRSSLLVLLSAFAPSAWAAQPGPVSAPSTKASAALPAIPVPEAAEDEESDADLPPLLHGRIGKAEYLRLRSEHAGLLRGIDPDPARVLDPAMRGQAIRQLEAQLSKRVVPTALSWIALGPAPIPNGQIQSAGTSPVTGRATAVVVDPTNSSKVYLGT